MEEKKKMTYDQLKEAAMHFGKEAEFYKKKYEEAVKANSKLVEEHNQFVEQANLSNLFQKVDYLFKIIENRDCFSSECVVKCVGLIEDFLFPAPVQDSEEEKKEE